MGQSIPIEQRGYRNPTQPDRRVEVLSYAELRHRVRDQDFTRLHRLDFHQLTLIEGGEGTTTIDFVELPCRPGTLLYVRPGQVQRLPVTASGNPADLDATLILFSDDLAVGLSVAKLTDDPFGPTAWQLDSANHDRMRRTLSDLSDACSLSVDHPPDTVHMLIRQLLSVVLLRLALVPHAAALVPTSDPTSSSAAERVRLLRHELERSFAVRHQASDYAADLGYSLKTLNRACTDVTGRTVKQLIDDRVALEAKRLLAHTDLSVASISHQLGFSEPTNFGKFFTRATGQTPGVFRETEADRADLPNSHRNFLRR